MVPRLHGRAAFLDMLLAALRENPCAALPPFRATPRPQPSASPKTLAGKLFRRLQDLQSPGSTAAP